MSDAKQALRHAVLDRLKSLDPREVSVESWAVCGHLARLPAFNAAVANGSIVAGYFPLMVDRGAEVDPWPTLKTCQRLALPLTEWHPKRFTLREIPLDRDWRAELQQGRYGLTEPGRHWQSVSPSDVGLVIVPGLAFDADGNRLGRGAGMYDRFLGDLPGETPTIGLALHAQIVDRVPVEAHDVPLSAVISADGALTRTKRPAR